MNRPRAAPRWAVDALEPLVLVSSALAGPDAPALVGGLLAPLVAEARELLATSRRRPTSEQHARWLLAFRPRTPHPPSWGVPGRLGGLVRAWVAGGAPVLAELEAPEAPWVQWSRRLALEQREGDVRAGPPRRRSVSASGRGRSSSHG